MKVVQIGTNNGDDHVRDLCRGLKPDLILLVEPFTIHNPEIHRNYTGISNYQIENVAITNDGESEKTLFYCDADGPSRGAGCSYHVTSIDPQHLVKHGYPPSALRTFTAPAMSLNNLLAKYHCEQLDFLFLDVEGIDFEVLQSLDFDRFAISHLQIEHLHLDRILLFQFMASKGFTPMSHGMDYSGFDTMFRRENR